MIIQKTRIILLSAAISASFISGWQVNGWRLGEKMQARETEISKNASQANFEARLLIRQAYEKKINQLEQQAKKAQEEKQKLQSLNKELSEKNDEHAKEYENALSTPDCADWDSLPVSCPVRVFGAE